MLLLPPNQHIIGKKFGGKGKCCCMEELDAAVQNRRKVSENVYKQRRPKFMKLLNIKGEKKQI